MEPQRRIVKKEEGEGGEGRKKSTALKKILTLHVASQNIHWKATLSAKLLLTQKFHSFTNTHFQTKKKCYSLSCGYWENTRKWGANKMLAKISASLYTQLYLFVAVHSILHTLRWCALPREKRLSAILGVKKKKNLQHQKRLLFLYRFEISLENSSLYNATDKSNTCHIVVEYVLPQMDQCLGM